MCHGRKCCWVTKAGLARSNQYKVESEDRANRDFVHTLGTERRFISKGIQGLYNVPPIRSYEFHDFWFPFGNGTP